MIDYAEHPPRRALCGFIECIWTLRGRADEAEPPSRILPDGCMEIVLNFADRFTRHHGSERPSELQPSLMLVGQMSTWIEVSPGRVIDLVGIRFRPGGAGAFLSTPASAIAGHTLNVRDIAPAIASAAEDAADLPDGGGRLARLQDALCRILRTGQDDAAVRAAVAHILARWGNVSISRLAASLGIHERTFERRFVTGVGLSPKMLARITRFQHVFHAVESGDDGWARVAARCGYYDQSHLLRDFRAFAGESPAILVSREIPMTRAFLRTGRSPDFSYTGQ